MIKRKILVIGIILGILTLSGCQSTEVNINETKIQYKEAASLSIIPCSTYDFGVARVLKDINKDLNVQEVSFREDNDLFGIVDSSLVQLTVNSRDIIYIGLYDEKIREFEDKGFSYYVPYKPTHLRDEVKVPNSSKNESTITKDESDEIYVGDNEISSDGDIDYIYEDSGKIDSIMLEKITVDGVTKTVQQWEILGEDLRYFGKGIPGDRMNDYILYQKYLNEKEKLLKNAGVYEEVSTPDDEGLIVIGG